MPNNRESNFGWALVGPGRIAHRFAEAVQGTEGMALVSASGRDRGRATEFATRWSREGKLVAAAGNIAELLDDDRVDAIYVATPHAFHAETIKRAIGARKAVLCEKPLVPDLVPGMEAVALSRKHRVFLMEAVWTRFLPVYADVRDWIRDGAIGRIRAIQSSFCFNLPFDPKHRGYDPLQAGGSLLDLGVYNLTMTRWALRESLGECPLLQSLHASGVVGPTGVDHRIAATLEFPGGVTAQFICGFDASADNTLRIVGENGTIVVPMFWQATEAQLRAGKDHVAVRRPFRINGFEYEIEEAVRAIGEGCVESPGIPHSETLETLRWMCRIREAVGVRYPFEAADEALQPGE
jgi:predicted dehydrogenase